MTKIQKVLALEAAIKAAADLLPYAVRQEVEKWLDSQYGTLQYQEDLISEHFGEHLEKQKEAVLLLAESPQVFGVKK